MIKLTAVPAKHSGFDLIFTNGVVVGFAYREIDGYFCFEPAPAHGFWSAWMMRAVADLLDEMNKPWDDRVRQELGAKHGKEA